MGRKAALPFAATQVRIGPRRADVRHHGRPSRPYTFGTLSNYFTDRLLSRCEVLRRPPPMIALQQVKLAVDFTNEHAQPPPSGSELAALSRVSARALQQGFRRFVGASIGAYQRQVDWSVRGRTCRASLRHRLRRIALRWGFTNAGRFSSRRYMACFRPADPRQALTRAACVARAVRIWPPRHEFQIPTAWRPILQAVLPLASEHAAKLKPVRDKKFQDTCRDRMISEFRRILSLDRRICLPSTSFRFDPSVVCKIIV